MARGRYRFKFRNLPLLPTLLFLLGSVLVILLLLSAFKRHHLEAQRFRQTWDHPTYKPQQKNELPKNVSTEKNGNANKTRVLKQPWELTSVEAVPKAGDPRLREVWNSSMAEWYYGCTEPTERYQTTSNSGINGYLMIRANGNLASQRAGIADSVAIARTLDATLVVPTLTDDKDTFENIFDVDHFISTLATDVRIVKQLPTDENLPTAALSFVAPRKASLPFYQFKLFQKLQGHRLIQLTETNNMLQDNLDPDLQKLRCRASYSALRFVPSITELGHTLIQRIGNLSKTGQYVAVHIRFDTDTLSASGCYFGGGEKERNDLMTYRRRWGRQVQLKDPHKERSEGKCPLTPMELGLLLRAMGFGEDSFVYLVMGSIYGGEETLTPLKKLFPHHYTLQSLATEEELAPFLGSESKFAAINYMVCEEGNVFIANDGSDTGKVVTGHRRFEGHRKTIRPNFEKLALLYVARHKLGWAQFASKTRIFQNGFTGEPNEQRGGDFYENPASCICARGEFELVKSFHEGRELAKRMRREDKRNIDEPERNWIELPEQNEDEKADGDGEPIIDEEPLTAPVELYEADDLGWPWLMN
ncbi:hypothetical protein R1flu_013591 [Riccia fluitans]|uniref:O-fucosyltransferase family protein n=1 Tax=Riccia fluitans TaxID=41844 RepID=A0ABD1YE15_9MARC